MKATVYDSGFVILPENRDESDAIEQWIKLTQSGDHEACDVVKFGNGKIERAATMSFTFGPDEIEHV